MQTRDKSGILRWRKEAKHAERRRPNINACCRLLGKSKDSMIAVFGIMYATMQIRGKDVCTPRKRRYGTMGHEVLKEGEVSSLVAAYGEKVSLYPRYKLCGCDGTVGWV
jgi:hypothetical protein